MAVAHSTKLWIVKLASFVDCWYKPRSNGGPVKAEARDISEFHDRIVEWRAKGLDWRGIAGELAKLNKNVDHNFLYRYAKRTGIPTAAVAQVRTAAQEARQDAPSPDSAASVNSPASLSADAISLAEITAWIVPAILRIEQATLNDDPDVQQKALKDAIAWLQTYEDIAPADFKQRIVDAIAGLRRFMEIRPASPPQPTEAVSGCDDVDAKPELLDLFVPLAEQSWSLDDPLLDFGGKVSWTLRDAFEGTLITGATGSGKTSGSGRTIATSMLQMGFGGLVLTAKEDEADLWLRYAEQTGRREQLCIVRPGGAYRFNFLDYQTRLQQEHGGSVENVVELFHSVLDAFARTRRRADSFWANSAKQLLRNLVRIFRGAQEGLNLRTLRRFLAEMPRDAKASKSEIWKATPVFGKLIAAAKRKRERPPTSDVGLDEAIDYFTADLPSLYHETRSIILMDFLSMIDLFFEPAIWQLFCEQTTLTPDAAFEGAIIVVDLPIKKHHATGRMAQLFWKHLFQQAVERRRTIAGSNFRPVFLWADEAQHFAADTDLLFQATARSSRCATVYLTQTLPGFEAAMGGDQPRERTAGLFANLTTKILHANGDPATNQWAAEQIGRSKQYRTNFTRATDPPKRGLSLFGIAEAFRDFGKGSFSSNEIVDFEVQPAEFTRLRTGGEENDCLVDAYVLKPGAAFPKGKQYFLATFSQEA